jgi:stage IV sporulation protein FB
MTSSWKLFDVFGVPVYLKYWFLLLFLFLSVKVVISVFISVLIHEIAHAYVAKKLGYETKSIVLDFLFGSANIDGDFTKNHKDSIKISLAGPLSNLLLAAISIPFSGLVISPLNDYFLYFASINIIFFIINMIPIFPLDGGRTSKGLLSIALGDVRGRITNGIISLIMTICVAVYAIVTFQLILILLCFIFFIASYGEITNKTINQEK